jgi:hypothetical protein
MGRIRMLFSFKFSISGRFNKLLNIIKYEGGVLYHLAPCCQRP